MKEQNIEQLFRNGLSHFEADVNPAAWSNISAGLQSPVPAQEVAGNAASAGKSIGLWGYAGIFVAATAVVVTAWLYNSSQNSSTETLSITKPVTAVSTDVSAAKISEPVAANEISPVEVKKNSVAEKTSQDNNGSEEKAVTPVMDEKGAAEKQSSANKPEIVPPVTADKAENNSEEKRGSNNTPVTPQIITDNVTSNSSITFEVVQPAENDFDFEFASVDNGIPHEQQSRADFAFYIPNVITPNGDNVNDDFKPMGLNFKDFELVIYDGNNVEIFRSKDIEHRWDGKLKDGTPAPVGTYIYVISVKDLSNVEHPQRGQLLLKR
jgi:gliding motility-associated-like protein